MPGVGQATARAKALRLYGTRQKKLYAKLYMHITCSDTKSHAYTNFFNDGGAFYQYLEATFKKPVGKIQLLKLKKDFESLDIPTHIGVDENSIQRLYNAIQRRSF